MIESVRWIYTRISSHLCHPDRSLADQAKRSGGTCCFGAKERSGNPGRLLLPQFESGFRTSLRRHFLISPCANRRPSRMRAPMRSAIRSSPASSFGRLSPNISSVITITRATFLQDVPVTERIASSICELLKVHHSRRSFLVRAKSCGPDVARDDFPVYTRDRRCQTRFRLRKRHCTVPAPRQTCYGNGSMRVQISSANLHVQSS